MKNFYHPQFLKRKKKAESVQKIKRKKYPGFYIERRIFSIPAKGEKGESNLQNPITISTSTEDEEGKKDILLRTILGANIDKTVLESLIRNLEDLKARMEEEEKEASKLEKE